jgi:hypothetical protein
MLCEGYKLQEPLCQADSSIPQPQVDQHLQQTAPNHHVGFDSRQPVGDRDTSVYHHANGSVATNKESPWLPLNGGWVNINATSFVAERGRPSHEGPFVLTHRLPLPINPDTGPVVMPPIDQVLNGQNVPSN